MLTIASALDREDERRFVGREREIAAIQEALDEHSATRVVFVCGEGGIGKSALLRAIRRRVDINTWQVAFLDGRDGAPTSEDLQAIVGHDRGDGARRLVILDTYDRLEGLGGQLRRELLPRMADGDRVLIAQRGRPHIDWMAGGWDRLVEIIELRPLDELHASELLVSSGVTDANTRAALAAWADGYPLALTLGAEAAGPAGEWSSLGLEDNPNLADLLVRRLIELELDPRYFDVVAVAAIARRTNAEMLTAVLPDVDGLQAAQWLRERSFAETLGGELTLHDLLRTSLRAWLSGHAPDRERELRRRIADHLFERAQRGHEAAISDISELIQNEAVSWAIGGLGDGSVRADTVSAQDWPELQATALERGRAEWWAATETLLREAPQCFVVARDPQSKIVGLCCFATPDKAPEACDRDPIFGPWLAHAREHHPGERVIVWRDALDLNTDGDVSSRAISVMNTSAVLRSGLGNPRWSYLPIDPNVETGVAFAQAKGADRLEGLDACLDEHVLECHVVDNGPGGMLGAHRALVYAETGALAPLAQEPRRTLERQIPITAEAVAEALRFLDRPLELARSPLAQGHTPNERVESVRGLLTRAVAEAFGTSPQENLMRELVSRAYMRGSGTHSQVASELHVSRTTYFRQLRVATDRVVQYVLDLVG